MWYLGLHVSSRINWLGNRLGEGWERLLPLPSSLAPIKLCVELNVLEFLESHVTMLDHSDQVVLCLGFFRNKLLLCQSIPMLAVAFEIFNLIA